MDWCGSCTEWRAGHTLSCVTVVPLCCFCNVALIFATMKTFILQQVKCCHLSSSKFNCTDNFLTPSLLISFFFLLFAFSSASSPHRLFSLRRSLPDFFFSFSWWSTFVWEPVEIWGGTAGQWELSRGISHAPSSVLLQASPLWVHSY